MGIDVVASLAAWVAADADVRITSTSLRASSEANSFSRSTLPTANRRSITKFCPSIQPSSCSLSKKVLSAEIGDLKARYPRCAPAGRARPTTGHAAAAPLTRVIKSRRLIASPDAKNRGSYQPAEVLWKGAGDVRFGSKADMCGAPAHVRFAPKSGLMQCTRQC